MESREQGLPASKWVGVDGALNDEVVRQREVLYYNRLARAVERFMVVHGGVLTSFVFKPMENRLTLLRELWLQENLFPKINLRVPRLVAWSTEPEAPAWGIFVDLGRLNHQLSVEDVAAAAGAVWQWQKCDLNSLPAIFDGQKPGLLQASETVREAWDSINGMLPTMGFSHADGLVFRHATDSNLSTLSEEKWLTHGDYHFENVARTDESVVVLDWEFVHINSVYWDLYTLLDMPHPRYRKSVTGQMRRFALERYAGVRKAAGRPVSLDFHQGYFLFTCIYSLWMLWLIQQDRIHGRWDTLELDGCQSEVGRTLRACREALP